MTTTPSQSRGARLDNTLTIFMSPKDFLELYEMARQKWMKAEPGDDLHLRNWNGDNYKVQFKLDRFRTEGPYGPEGSIIPPVTVAAMTGKLVAPDAETLVSAPTPVGGAEPVAPENIESGAKKKKRK